jgi:hypothetical protein
MLLRRWSSRNSSLGQAPHRANPLEVLQQELASGKPDAEKVKLLVKHDLGGRLPDELRASAPDQAGAQLLALTSD